MIWYLYIIKTANNTLYTGITTDVERRFLEHSSGDKGAKYLKGKGPLELVFYSEAGDRSRASKLEYAVKKLSRKKKDALIKGQLLLMSLLDTTH